MDEASLEALPPEMRARFEVLRQIFAEGLPGRLAEIQNAQSAQDRIAALHRLAGASGSFGHATLCDLARQSEHALLNKDDTLFNQILPRLLREIEHILSA